MAHGKITKQPFERKDYSFDFSEELEADEIIELISCQALDLGSGKDASEGIISADPAPVVSDLKVIFWLEDGEDGDRYNVRIRVETSKGQKLEGLLLAEKYGFVPMVITLNVSIGATHLVAQKLKWTRLNQ